MNYVTDKIGEVVDLMRKTGTFTGSKTGNIYTMTGKNTLVNKEWVSISGNEYKVYDVTSNSFKIETSNEITDGTFKSLAPYFIYGHRLEINNILLEKDKDSKYKFQKYPLIALRMPFSVDRNVTPGINEASLNIAFMEFTEKEYRTPQRYEHVITPILEPLLNDFLSKLVTHSTFILTDDNFTQVDRPFWGISEGEGNAKYIFNDPLDAIELQNLRLKFQIYNC